MLARKVDDRLHGTGSSKSQGAGSVYYNHLNDKVDSDQKVVKKELSRCVILARQHR